ncbi:DUF3135 domain-containing protein [Vibrio sp. S4M6]|uniref:DUF3135 domain-containing protein n=1 Tax=Vibrio sinus TaxID=2946865 RepID=UPI00202A6AC4|nr:DUF3135 domain-containing protein [Vibrio sinus]MCL9780378.1 DUF3135 domain-containing protein [Vibrio sinus]
MGVSSNSQVLPSFDEMMELAKQDPKAFNSFKKEMCEEMILSASLSMQSRLRAQQSHIDLVVSRCKNPTHTNVVLMRELSQQICRFQGVLIGDADDTRDTAIVIPFAAPLETSEQKDS